MGIRFCIVLDNYGLKKEFSKFMICLSIIKLSFFFQIHVYLRWILIFDFFCFPNENSYAEQNTHAAQNQNPQQRC